MSELSETTFTPEEISLVAQGNVAWLCLAAISYLKENNLSVDDFWAYVGEKFAPSWKQGMPLKTIALSAARNMVSAGGELVSISGDEASVKAVVAGWPGAEDLEYFDLSQEDADSLWNIFAPIAKYLDCSYKYQRQGNEVTMTFSKDQ
jgi:hypothetical protein